MKQYDGIKDEELISRFKNGESEILDYLMEKYKNMVRKKARTMFLIGGENDDLIQEGMIGLFKAVRDYQPDRDAAANRMGKMKSILEITGERTRSLSLLTRRMSRIWSRR